MIAETRDLPTRYAKMVVTDDMGRFVLPDLPKAKYKVWVRGYGLVDSAKVDARAGPAAQSARGDRRRTKPRLRKYYPAIYWYSTPKIRRRTISAGSTDIPAKVRLQRLDEHRCGTTAVSAATSSGKWRRARSRRPSAPVANSTEAWVRRISSGQSGAQMVNQLAGPLGGVPFRYFARLDLPRRQRRVATQQKPTRPQGVERNIVVTTWDWGTEKHYLHDLIASDRRSPDGERLRSGVRLARILDRRVADPQSGQDHTVTYLNSAVLVNDTTVRRSDQGHAASDTLIAAVGVLHGADLGHRHRTITMPCSIATAGSGCGART